jgi:hypothetical protein
LLVLVASELSQGCNPKVDVAVVAHPPESVSFDR